MQAADTAFEKLIVYFECENIKIIPEGCYELENGKIRIKIADSKDMDQAFNFINNQEGYRVDSALVDILNVSTLSKQ